MKIIFVTLLNPFKFKFVSILLGNFIKSLRKVVIKALFASSDYTISSKQSTKYFTKRKISVVSYFSNLESKHVSFSYAQIKSPVLPWAGDE